jgi:hypothetical protein
VRKLTLIPALSGLLFALAGSVQATPDRQLGLPVIPPCEEAPTLPVCEVQKEWDIDLLEAREADIWLDGEELTFVHEDGEAEALFMTGGLNTLIRPSSPYRFVGDDVSRERCTSSSHQLHLRSDYQGTGWAARPGNAYLARP